MNNVKDIVEDTQGFLATQFPNKTVDVVDTRLYINSCIFGKTRIDLFLDGGCIKYKLTSSEFRDFRCLRWFNLWATFTIMGVIPILGWLGWIILFLYDDWVTKPKFETKLNQALENHGCSVI